MYLFTATGFTGTLRECDEGDLEWVDKAAVPSLPLWAGDKIFFRLLAEDAPFFLLKLRYRGRHARRGRAQRCAGRALKSQFMTGGKPYMRRKKQIQAMQQELALLRQTIDSGKELAALATNTAQQLKKPSIKTVAVQLMRSPRFRRTALIVGGAAAVGTIGAARRALPVLPDHRRAGSGKGAQARACPARRPAGDRGRHGRGRGHRAGKDPQGEKVPPLRQESDRKMLRRPRPAEHFWRGAKKSPDHHAVIR